MSVLLVKLFLTFLKIGFIGFGGGLAILPLIYQGVSNFCYISEEEFANLFGISQATPGPIAVNAATFVGFKAAGIEGALAATIGVAIPSMILVMIAVRLLDKYKEHDLVKGALCGIRPATIGMVGAAVLYIGKGALLTVDSDTIANMSDLMSGLNIEACVIAILAFVLAMKTKLGAIRVIIIMAAAGALLVYVKTLF